MSLIYSWKSARPQQRLYRLFFFFSDLSCCFSTTAPLRAPSLLVSRHQVRVFVSRFGMPDDLRDGYDADGHRFVRASDDAEIAEGTAVRLRLIGVRCYAAEINATGTITNDYLGIQGA